MLRNWREETMGQERLENLRKRIYLLQQEAFENQRIAAEIQQSNHNQQAVSHHFEVGDKVILRKELREEQGVIGKLNWCWRGPYVVTEVINPVTYRLANQEGKDLSGTAHAMDMAKIED